MAARWVNLQKCASNEDGFWGRKEIDAEAANRAGFSSAEMARRAGRVLADGNREIREAICRGELSISGAYSQLRPTGPSRESAEQDLASNVSPNPFIEDEPVAGGHQDEEDQEDHDDHDDHADDPSESKVGEPPLRLQSEDHVADNPFAESDESVSCVAVSVPGPGDASEYAKTAPDSQGLLHGAVLTEAPQEGATEHDDFVRPPAPGEALDIADGVSRKLG